MMNRVLVTGAAGFIGRHVAREYSSRGWEVIGMGRSNWVDWQRYGLSVWHCCEVTLEELVNRAGHPDVIVHCAGGASVGFSVEEPYQDFIKTVDTMAQVLEFIRKHTPDTKLVYPSSAAVYGQVTQLPIVEEAPLNPVSPYGAHKKMAESLCKLYAHQYGVSVAIVRLFSIYGAGLNKQLLWDACQKFAHGDSRFFGTGEEIRDWLHVDDVANLLYIAAEKTTALCPVANAGSGLGVSVKDILKQLGEQLGGTNDAVFSSKSKAGDPNSYIADIAVARAWDWAPAINWRAGVTDYVNWYKQCR